MKRAMLIFFVPLFWGLSAAETFGNTSSSDKHGSTILETDTGELWLAWFEGTKEGARDTAIYGVRRSKQSEWGATEKWAEFPGQPVWNPVLFQTKAGKIWLYYKAGPSPETWTAYRKLWRGKTWGPSEALPAGLTGPVRSKPIRLSDGRLLAGASSETWNLWASYVESSEGEGLHRNRSGPIRMDSAENGSIPPVPIELELGRLLLLARTRNLGRVVRSHSDDSGKTWSDFLPTALPNPNSAIDGVRLPDRRVVVAYNDSEKHRYPLSLAVSADGGKTWRKLGDVVGEAGEYSYPAMVTSVSGGVHLAWTSNRRHIEYRYVPESFFK